MDLVKEEEDDDEGHTETLMLAVVARLVSHRLVTLTVEVNEGDPVPEAKRAGEPDGVMQGLADRLCEGDDETDRERMGVALAHGEAAPDAVKEALSEAELQIEELPLLEDEKMLLDE